MRKVGQFRDFRLVSILLLILFFGSLFGFPVSGYSAEKEKPARMQVRGYGILGNRALKRALNLIVDSDEAPHSFTATQIEDAALLMLAQVREDGYLRPMIEAEWTLEDEEV